MVVPPEVMGELEARKQQIGQLNLLAAIVAYYSMTPYLAQREVMHFILRGCGEGWANHFSVHARKESALIIAFVSGSHIAELINTAPESY